MLSRATNARKNLPSACMKSSSSRAGFPRSHSSAVLRFQFEWTWGPSTSSNCFLEHPTRPLFVPEQSVRWSPLPMVFHNSLFHRMLRGNCTSPIDAGQSLHLTEQIARGLLIALTVISAQVRPFYDKRSRMRRSRSLPCSIAAIPG